jgi:4'-phosphopantetheinyl transferase
LSEVPELVPRTVHLWYADLDPPPAVVASLRPLLSPDELERAARFRFEKHRRRYVVRRGQLRRLLGSYLGRPAGDLVFDYGERGKPAVAGEGDKPPHERLEFNLSDSEDLTVYAVAHGAEIGVDVEILRPMPDALSISESFFSAPERETLRAVPEERRAEAFFNCWTRKEAYLKAIGEGLSEPLDSFVVTLAPGDPPRFLDFFKVEGEVAAWSLYHLRPTGNSIAALALRRVGWSFEECGWV